MIFRIDVGQIRHRYFAKNAATNQPQGLSDHDQSKDYD